MKFTSCLTFRGSRIALISGAGAAVLFLIACRDPNESASEGHEHGAASAAGTSGEAVSEQLYQCSMHPNIVSDKPGTCPICAMDLQPVKKIDAKGIPGRAPVDLTDQQQQLINIRLSPVVKQPASKTIRSVGVVSYDETRVADVNARIMGWVETLYVDKPGQPVEKGQPLMALYSPDLYSAQQDYLLAYQSAQNLQTNAPVQSEQLRRFSAMNRTNTLSLSSSARKRLELWGISPEQIQALENSGQASNTMILNSPITGVVVDKNVFPQQMIQPGTRLYRIANLSRVWIEPEIYEYEVPLVEVGQEAKVHVPAYPGVTFEGEVDFIYPYVDPKTRTVRIRLVFDNPENRLKPGMYANAIIEASLGEQVLVAATAVFDTGRRAYVFTQKEPGVFIPKLVRLGPRVGDYRVVQSGLEPGEKVVVDGNFLLDSESQLKAAAIGSIETDEEAPETTIEHSTTSIPLPASAAPLFSAIFTNYLAMGKALSGDEIRNLHEPLNNLREDIEALRMAGITPPQNQAEYANQLAQLLEKARGFDASSLEAARISYGDLSQPLITLTAHFTPPLPTTLYVAECPMWKKSPPRWIQFSEALENPFMGPKMLQCGEIILTIEPSPEPVPMPPAAADIYRPLIEAYLEIGGQLQQDSLDEIAALAARLQAAAAALPDSGVKPPRLEDHYQKYVEELVAAADAFTRANRESARVSYGHLSFALIALLTHFPPPLDQPLTVVNCPMWNESPGRWLQRGQVIENPYMGQKMPQCGELVSVLEPAAAVSNPEGAQP